MHLSYMDSSASFCLFLFYLWVCACTYTWMTPEMNYSVTVTLVSGVGPGELSDLDKSRRAAARHWINFHCRFMSLLREADLSNLTGNNAPSTSSTIANLKPPNASWGKRNDLDTNKQKMGLQITTCFRSQFIISSSVCFLFKALRRFILFMSVSKNQILMKYG